VEGLREEQQRNDALGQPLLEAQKQAQVCFLSSNMSCITSFLQLSRCLCVTQEAAKKQEEYLIDVKAKYDHTQGEVAAAMSMPWIDNRVMIAHVVFGGDRGLARCAGDGGGYSSKY